MENKRDENGKALNRNLSDFLSQLDSLNGTMPFVATLIDMNQQADQKELVTFINSHTIKKEVTDLKDSNDSSGSKEEVLSLKLEDHMVFETLSKNARTSAHAKKLIPESLFVSLISQFDAFLGALIKVIYQIHPEKLHASEKNISFSKLNEFESIEEIHEYIIEKEVESVLRESHSFHFEWLERKLEIPLRKDLSVWKEYIEITERRNLFVHNSGKVSNQYLNICKDHTCDLPHVKVGSRLSVSNEYFHNCYKCLYELSVKLTHVIWRKLLPGDLMYADSALNNLCYDLIHKERYDLADILLSFSTETLKKHHDEAIKNYLLINKALSKYLGGRVDEAKQIIEKKDWSATSINFKLAVNILLEKYENVYKLMEQIGTTGEIPEHAYQIWPLFNKIRKEPKFQETFKKIFTRDYKVIEKPSPVISKLIDVLDQQRSKISKKRSKVKNN